MASRRRASLVSACRRWISSRWVEGWSCPRQVDRGGEGAVGGEAVEDLWVFEDGEGLGVHGGGIIVSVV